MFRYELIIYPYSTYKNPLKFYMGNLFTVTNQVWELNHRAFTFFLFLLSLSLSLSLSVFILFFFHSIHIHLFQYIHILFFVFTLSMSLYMYMCVCMCIVRWYASHRTTINAIRNGRLARCYSRPLTFFSSSTSVSYLFIVRSHTNVLSYWNWKWNVL